MEGAAAVEQEATEELLASEEEALRKQIQELEAEQQQLAAEHPHDHPGDSQEMHLDPYTESTCDTVPATDSQLLDAYGNTEDADDDAQKDVDAVDAMSDCEIVSNLQKMIPPLQAVKTEPLKESRNAPDSFGGTKIAASGARAVATPVRGLAMKAERSVDKAQLAPVVQPVTSTDELPEENHAEQGNLPEKAPEEAREDSVSKRGLEGADQPASKRPKRRELTRQEMLNLAAKARIRRMVAPHKRRTDLEAPEYLKKYWEAGTKEKEELAELLKKCNFDRDSFISTVERVVVKKEKLTMKLDQGWYSEGELRDELHWPASRIDGVKRHCMANKETHVRANVYDGELEYWVTVRERGEKKQTLTREERQSQKEQGGPVELPDKCFDGLGSLENRLRQDNAHAATAKESGQYAQEKEMLKKFCDSLTSKSCKLRALVKELRTHFPGSDQAKQAMDELNKAVQKLEHCFEECNDELVHSEVHGFSEEFKKRVDQKIKTGTQVAGKAAAAEQRIRNAKKYFDKPTTKKPSNPSGKQPEAEERAPAPKAKAKAAPAGKAKAKCAGSKKAR